MLFLWFSLEHILAHPRYTGRCGNRKGMEMTRIWELRNAIANRVQVLSKLVAWSSLGLSNVEEAMSGWPHAVDKIRMSARQSMLYLEGLFRTLDTCEKVGGRTSVAPRSVAWERAKGQGGMGWDGLADHRRSNSCRRWKGVGRKRCSQWWDL